MNGKITISIITFFLIIVIGFALFKFSLKNNSVPEQKNSSNDMFQNNVTNTINVSTKYINDDCVNEWTNYSKIIDEDIELASNTLINQNLHYLLKNVDGYIVIYYLNDYNEEILYKNTDISTEYLSTEDLNNLEDGIEVIGSKELNKLLEDFE